MNETSRLDQTVKAFCQFIKALPGGSLTEQKWGPREVLAHLVFHHERYLKLSEACLYGLPCEPLSGKYRQINAAAVASNRGQTVEALVDRLEKVNRELVEIYKHHDPAKIQVEIKTGVKLRTLEELVPEVEAHVRNHLVKLQKAFRVAPQREVRDSS